MENSTSMTSGIFSIEIVLNLRDDASLCLFPVCLNSTNRSKQQDCLAEMMPPLWTSYGSKLPLKFNLSGLLTSLSGQPTSANGHTVMKMCPPLTVKNWNYYQPLVAVGCSNGAIQICDVASGLVKKEMAVHNYPVKGMLTFLIKLFL